MWKLFISIFQKLYFISYEIVLRCIYNKSFSLESGLRKIPKHHKSTDSNKKKSSHKSSLNYRAASSFPKDEETRLEKKLLSY